MGWLIAAAILTLIAIVPLGGRIRYNSQGLRAWILIGPVKISVFPLKKKKREEKPEKPKEEKQKALKPKKKQEKQDAPMPQVQAADKPAEKGGSVKDFIPFVRLALDFLGDLRRKLRVRKLTFRVILAGDDPCDLAVTYGKTWAAVANFLPLLERALVIGSREIEVECDFAAEKTLVIAGADVTITVGRICVLGVRYGVRALRELIRFKDKRKGGAVK